MNIKRKYYEDELNDKIIACLEKLSSLFRNLFWQITKEKKLSPIQIQFLLYLNRHPAQMRKVSQLSQEFSLTPATVSEAIAALEKKGFLSRNENMGDKRTRIINLTKEGKKIIKELAKWPNLFKEPLSKLQEKEKENNVLFLMKLIALLQEEGLINVARMCLCCQHFVQNKNPNSDKPHYCSFLEKDIGIKELQVDCLMHKQI